MGSAVRTLWLYTTKRSPAGRNVQRRRVFVPSSRLSLSYCTKLFTCRSGQGDPVKVAQTIHSALEQSRTPLAAPAAPATAIPLELDTAGFARSLGVAGKVSGGVYQVSVPRRETIRESGHEIPPSMGVATEINFHPTGAGKAAITGDFVMRASEVNDVIRAL